MSMPYVSNIAQTDENMVRSKTGQQINLMYEKNEKRNRNRVF